MRKSKTSKSFYQRLGIIAVLYFGVQFFFSCEPPEPIFMSYNKISIEAVNNASVYVNFTQPIDILYSKAVAFNLTIADTTDTYVSRYSYFKKALSFKQAYAMSIPDPSYIPSESVESVTIYSLFDINGAIKAGDIITEHLLFVNFENQGLYNGFDAIYAHYNGEQTYKNSSAVLVLKTEVENTQAQFKVEVVLDDGSILTTTSPVFTIIPSE